MKNLFGRDLEREGGGRDESTMRVSYCFLSFGAPHSSVFWRSIATMHLSNTSFSACLSCLSSLKILTKGVQALPLPVSDSLHSCTDIRFTPSSSRKHGISLITHHCRLLISISTDPVLLT